MDNKNMKGTPKCEYTIAKCDEGNFQKTFVLETNEEDEEREEEMSLLFEQISHPYDDTINFNLEIEKYKLDDEEEEIPVII